MTVEDIKKNVGKFLAEGRMGEAINVIYAYLKEHPDDKQVAALLEQILPLLNTTTGIFTLLRTWIWILGKNEYMDEQGFIHVYTGSGKGKTMAAFGLALLAAGAGKKFLLLSHQRITLR